VRGPLRLAYDVVAEVARAATSVAPAGRSKVIRSLHERNGLLARYRAWGSASRDTSRPLLWMHAPSVGEGLMARPILQRLRRDRASLQLAYTWFSPSAVNFAQGVDVDFRDYLPLDTVRDSAAALDALRPTALVFSKLDVWPNLTSVARRRGVKLGLISASLSAGSSRRSGIGRALLGDAYAALDVVGAVDQSDADRLVALGVRKSAIEVTGDTRYDQVWDRAANAEASSPWFASLSSDRPTVVAGSTWPADEAVILPAFTHLLRSSPEVRLIIAPHEPTPGHLDAIFAWARRSDISAAALSDPESMTTDVVVVDRMGVLADLYALASVAYVGGGFHSAGLHSVLEPAAFDAPVIFGPRHEMSRDAQALLRCGGAIAVADEKMFVTTVTRWLKDADKRLEAAECARSVVRDGLGAAERTYALVERLLV
jgi:3-deoxy-D-manno-octulosonic-acid transferase